MFAERTHLQRFGAMIACVALLASFGLHAVQVEHEHPQNSFSHQHAPNLRVATESAPDTETTFVFLADEMHHSDKKWWLLLIASVFATVVVSGQLRLQQSIQEVARATRSLLLHSWHVTKPFNYLLLFFAIGKLNPKLF